MQLPILLLLTLSIIACDEQSKGEQTNEVINSAFAEIQDVNVSGTENAYTFSVTISSPDTGCEQYADWWEIVDEQENLIYRRILAHSHVNEQPFSRSGGKVNISVDRKVWIRAHMNNSGYGLQAFFGSVKSGFEENNADKDFALDLEKSEPLPADCQF